MRFASLLLLSAASFAADLTGNWVIRQPMGDGTSRNTYIHIKQDGGRYTGNIRVTQFHYTIRGVTGGPDGFTIDAALADGHTERKVAYEGKLVGEELHVTTRGRNGAPGPEMIARRAAEEEGAYPKRIDLPPLHKLPYNGLAKTPPMGWNSWNRFHGRVDNAAVRGIADAMASNGMKEAGYLYVNIDDTWQGERDAQGIIHPNRKFPDMKALADYVHSKGLKLGIYSSPGPNTCAGYEGSYGHEDQDARTYAAWGIDYLKYDWCGARNLYTDEEMQAVYQKMGDALRAAGRPIVFSLCQYGRADVWKWGPEVGGNLWRTTGDISDRWDSMSRIGFGQNDLAPWAGPGHWNDPDMLEIGNGGMTDAEYRTHMSMWSILAAPLLAGNDLRSMSEATKEILTNPEVIAIDQDHKGVQGVRVRKDGDIEVWKRPLADGAAIALVNRGADTASISVRWAELGITAEAPTVRDVWAHKDIDAPAELTAAVPSHGTMLVTVR